MSTEPELLPWEADPNAPIAPVVDQSHQRDPIWDFMKERAKAKFDADRQRFMAKAVAEDDGGWTKHTEWHWSRCVNGERLDYWPSRKKYQWRGQVRRGDVMAIISKEKA